MVVSDIECYKYPIVVDTSSIRTPMDIDILFSRYAKLWNFEFCAYAWCVNISHYVKS